MVPLVDCFYFTFVVVVCSYFVKSRCLHVWPPTGQHVFFTLSFIKMSHLKVWSDDRSASLKIRKQRH